MVKPKLLFLVHTLTKYDFDYFDELNKIYNLKVLVIDKHIYKNYNFIFPFRRYLINIEKFDDKKRKIKELILKYVPNFIIFGGYRIRYSLFIRKIIKQLGIKYYYRLEKINNDSTFKFIIKKNIFSLFFKKANGIIAHGKIAKKFYLRYNNNVINLPYSIKIKKSNFKKKISKKIKFLFVGQLIKRKGIDLLIDAINNLDQKYLKESFFTIVGNGKFSKQVKNLLKNKINLNYFSFQNQKKLKKIYKENDVLIFPSRFDGWGVVPMEAMQHRMFLIISKNCGVTEILKNKSKNIILKNDLSDLTKQIKFCVNNKKLVNSEGQKNFKLIFNSICNIDKSIKIFNKEFN